MPYMLFQFKKVNNHKIGATNIDIKRIGIPYSNFLNAEIALAKLMDEHRINAFVRIDRNVRWNPVAYADLNKNGGIVRFRLADEDHYSKAINLDEFKRKIEKERIRANTRKQYSE